jgi:hypothetical protein
VHVLVERVNLLQRTRVGIDLTKRKFYFAQTSNNPQDVKSPSAFLDTKTLEWAKAFVGVAYVSWLDREAITYNPNLCILRNSAEENIAADPAGSTCRCRKRWATFNRRQGESEVWNQNDIANRPLFNIVVKDKRLGVLSSRIARLISEYAASTILVPKAFDRLFNWNGDRQELQ